MTANKIINALDHNARSTADVAARVGLPVSQVGPILQALAVGPIRGIVTARGKELERLNTIRLAVRKSYLRAHLGEPLWMRGDVAE